MGTIGPPPTWHWRTFPVFFAFSAALFLGVYLGLVVSETSDSGNNIPTLVVFLGTAILFGAALSRLTTGYILRRRWARVSESRGAGDDPA